MLVKDQEPFQELHAVSDPTRNDRYPGVTPRTQVDVFAVRPGEDHEVSTNTIVTENGCVKSVS